MEVIWENLWQTLSRARIYLTTFVVIVSDTICQCKSYYHTSAATTITNSWLQMIQNHDTILRMVFFSLLIRQMDRNFPYHLRNSTRPILQHPLCQRRMELAKTERVICLHHPYSNGEWKREWSKTKCCFSTYSLRVLPTIRCRLWFNTATSIIDWWWEWEVCITATTSWNRSGGKAQKSKRKPNNYT